MMYHAILVPLDGSAFSERALPMATTLARALRAQVILVRAASASVFPEQILLKHRSRLWRRPKPTYLPWQPGCPSKA